MLFTFKSAACADLIMHEKNGKEILALLGKNPEETRGIITVEQLPVAIATLRNAIVTDRANLRMPDDDADSFDPASEQAVRLPQRALPFVDMLECAAKEGKAVVWGV